MARIEPSPLEDIMAERFAGKAIVAAKLLGLPELESILDFHDAAIATYNPGKGEADARDAEVRAEYARLSRLIRTTDRDALIEMAYRI